MSQFVDCLPKLEEAVAAVKSEGGDVAWIEVYDKTLDRFLWAYGDPEEAIEPGENCSAVLRQGERQPAADWDPDKDDSLILVAEKPFACLNVKGNGKESSGVVQTVAEKASEDLSKTESLRKALAAEALMDVYNQRPRIGDAMAKVATILCEYVRCEAVAIFLRDLRGDTLSFAAGALSDGSQLKPKEVRLSETESTTWAYYCLSAQDADVPEEELFEWVKYPDDLRKRGLTGWVAEMGLPLNLYHAGENELLPQELEKCEEKYRDKYVQQFTEAEGRGLSTTLVSSRRRIVFKDVEDSETPLLIVPIKDSQGQLLGAARLRGRLGLRAFTVIDQEIAEYIADQICTLFSHVVEESISEALDKLGLSSYCRYSIESSRESQETMSTTRRLSKPFLAEFLSKLCEQVRAGCIPKI